MELIGISVDHECQLRRLKIVLIKSINDHLTIHMGLFQGKLFAMIF